MHRAPLRDGGRVHGLRPRHSLLTRAQRSALHQLAAARGGLSVSAARVLHAVIRGRPLSERNHDVPAEAAIELQQLGLIEHRVGGMYLDPTPDVRYGLLLTDTAAPA